MDVKLSEDEAKLYDRQIRLWGLDAQKRLRSSRVLVAGMRGLGCEVVKNLVLAGIKSLTMLDQANLTAEDGLVNFLAPTDKVGTNRAEACMDRVKQLNPMVEVSFENANVTEKDEGFFKNFDIVVIVGYPRDDLIKINKLCHENEIKFFAGDVLGFFGYSFMDLVDHEYSEEIKVAPEGTDDTVDLDEEPKAKKVKKEEHQEDETKLVKRHSKFSTLQDSLNVDWSQASYAKRIKRMDPSFFILHVLYEFHSREGRFPKEETQEADLKLLLQLKNSVTEKFNLPETKIPDEMISLLFSEISPVAAIVGGVLSQEIIKTISNKDAPHKNFFLFNPLQSAGIVESVGC